MNLPRLLSSRLHLHPQRGLDRFPGSVGSAAHSEVLQPVTQTHRWTRPLQGSLGTWSWSYHTHRGAFPTQSRKWAEDLNRHFSKEDTQIANKDMTKKMLNIAHYQRNGNQNYNEVSPHTNQNGHHHKSANNKCWRGCGEKGILSHCWWGSKLIQPRQRTAWKFLKKQNYHMIRQSHY